MKFTEILNELRKGEKVTREKWENSKTERYKYIQFEHGECVAILKNDTETYVGCVFDVYDFTAEDWKIWVEKPKDIKIRNWQPKKNEYYYAILSWGTFDYSTYDSNNIIDRDRLSLGNCFKTREEAQYMIEKIKIINQLRQISNISFEGTLETKKWFIIYDCDCQKIGYNYLYTTKALPFDVFFKSKNDCIRAVNMIGEDNLKKYYFDIVEEGK